MKHNDDNGLKKKRKILRKIEIDAKDEYRAKIEDTQQEDAWFRPVYERANAITKEVVERSIHFEEENKGRSGVDDITRGYSNNIIFFDAERGAGKTSAMLSFSAFLSKGLQQGEQPKEGDCRNGVTYEVFDTIDPSHMSERDSIMRVLLSKLLLRTNEHIKALTDRHERSAEMIELFGLFSKCYEAVSYFIEERTEELETDDIESLNNLGSSTQLKENLYYLIDSYLELSARVGACNSSSTRYNVGRPFLVVQIDDADLFLGDVFKICDSVRRYLTIPNVIVLMAADYRQLTRAIQKKYVSQNSILLQAGIDETAVRRECEVQAARFMEKVFPDTMRIRLPEVQSIMLLPDGQKRLVYHSYDGNDDILPKADKEVLADIILKLIYNKTGMIFYPDDYTIHPIIPQTLRELVHFLKLLSSMEDVDNYKLFASYSPKGDEGNFDVEEAAIMKENMDRFYDYFTSTWVNNNLLEEDKNEIRAIENEADPVLCAQKFYDIDQNVTRSFRHAFYIYFTILLNRMFVDAILNEGAFNTLFDYARILFTLDKVQPPKIVYFWYWKKRAENLINSLPIESEKRLSMFYDEEAANGSTLFNLWRPVEVFYKGNKDVDSVWYSRIPITLADVDAAIDSYAMEAEQESDERSESELHDELMSIRRSMLWIKTVTTNIYILRHILNEINSLDNSRISRHMQASDYFVNIMNIMRLVDIDRSDYFGFREDIQYPLFYAEEETKRHYVKCFYYSEDNSEEIISIIDRIRKGLSFARSNLEKKQSGIKASYIDLLNNLLKCYELLDDTDVEFFEAISAMSGESVSVNETYSALNSMISETHDIITKGRSDKVSDKNQQAIHGKIARTLKAIESDMKKLDLVQENLASGKTVMLLDDAW